MFYAINLYQKIICGIRICGMCIKIKLNDLKKAYNNTVWNFLFALKLAEQYVNRFKQRINKYAVNFSVLIRREENTEFNILVCLDIY